VAVATCYEGAVRIGLFFILLLAACDETSSSRMAPPPMPTAPPIPPPEDPTKSVLASANADAPDAAPKPFTPLKVTGAGGVMGTHVNFAAFTTPTVDTEKTKAAFEAAIAEMKRVEDLMTTWRDSEVYRINANAGKAPVKVGDETFAVIKESIHASQISEGTFDITFQSLHGLWKFDEDIDPHPPTDAQIKAKLPFVNYRNLVLNDKDAQNKTIMISKPETQISLGGIAKGYGVDMAVKVLEKAGLESFFVQAGGDLFARGKKPDGTDWQSGIRDPRGKEGVYFAKIPLTDHAFSTAGDYERSYVVDGKRYHHIIDPRTGHPATACRSVTIWAPTALLADEIDDAVFILGPEKGAKLVESLDGVAAVIVDAKNNVHITKRLQGKVEITGAPTDGI
jgi:thiamine biosynthesis lipoprotein